MLFFNVMAMVYRNIVDLPFGACQYTATWFSTTYINIQHICSFMDCFALEVLAEFQANFPVMNIRCLCSICQRYRFLCKCIIRKEGDNPCGLPITDTAFGIYVSINLLIHLWHFLFFFSILCVSIVRVSFCAINYFLCISFLKYCLEGTSSSIFFLSFWLHVVYDPPRSILVGTICRIS